jgi:hypothetical protein
MPIAAGLIGALGAAGLLTATATTKQGVDFAVSARPVPLRVKAMDFLHRHEHYRLLAREIAGGLAADEARVRAVFEWTRREIRPTPPGWPVIDDHILHIIIRGHGLPDQMADVFTTLSTYAGVPAFWRVLDGPESRAKLVLSFARVDGRWAIFDVAHGFVFADAEGRLLSAEAIAADPALVLPVVGEARPGGVPYARFLERFRFSRETIPDPLRARLQMPAERLWYEAGKRLGWVRQ